MGSQQAEVLKRESVGILAMEIYFPNHYVDQSALEEYDNVPGKYTVGLGQKEMGFCYENEDINSLCLTVVAHLMEKNHISFMDIGRMEVGTETIIDKSKSVKSTLMKLFEESGNYAVEGVDSLNACYGGTNALFNAVAWVESSAWDGRYALVVCGDIAVYASGTARCTGGAGSVAMLIGPNAPLVIEAGLRGTYMKHVYDFYKPDLTTEYPYVDGKLSVCSYITALDACYKEYCKKAEAKQKGEPFSLQNFDYMAFHSPYCKLVQKSLARLSLNDFVKEKTCYYLENHKKGFENLSHFRSLSLEESVNDKSIEKSFMVASNNMFNEKTSPSLLLARRVGNMYTSSLYGGLISLLISVPLKDLYGKRIGMFSYGSGLASSMFSISVSTLTTPLQPLKKAILCEFDLKQMIANLEEVWTRLEHRSRLEPAEFNGVLERREKYHKQANYVPVAYIDSLYPGTFYLSQVDDKYRRTYTRKPLSHSYMNGNA